MAHIWYRVWPRYRRYTINVLRSKVKGQCHSVTYNVCYKTGGDRLIDFKRGASVSVHVQRTCALTVYTVAHVRRACVTYRMFPTTHVFVVHVWAWPLDHSILQSDVTGCVIQLLSGVWCIQKFNAQSYCKISKCLSTTQYLHNVKVTGLHFYAVNMTELINLQTNKLWSRCLIN